MTNPGNIVRVRARNGGRASVYEANGWAQAYTSGLLEGNGVTQNTVADMKVLVGGSTTKPDVVLAVNPAGYRIALDLIGQQALTLTTPASNKRISAIVAYTDDLSLATTEDTVTGSPASCGLIVVNGTAAANPVDPTDAQIRTAITSDGATGSQASYCVIATILVADNTTVIDNSLITAKNANLAGSAIVEANNINTSSLPGYTFTPQSFSKTKSVGSTWTDFDSYTIVNSGLYIIEIDFQGGATTTQYRSNARVTKNGTKILGCGEFSSEAWSGNQFTEGETTMAFWLNTGDVIKSQGRNENWTGNLAVGMQIQQIY